MNCPKCKSGNVSESTAETLRCGDCDFAWVPHGTAARFTGAGVKKSEPGVGVIIWPVILVGILLLTALGFLTWLLAAFFIFLAIFGAVVMQFSGSRGGK